MPSLSNKSFELIENRGGHAAGSTVMRFDSSSDPNRAVYSGPNVKVGHAMVVGDEMVYHAVDFDGQLSAGRAKITIIESAGETEMHLNWQWLTGDRSTGLSKWRQVDA